MTERIYKEFHVHAASQLVESVEESANSMYYVFSSKHRAYSESSTPTPSNSIANSLYQTYDEMQFGKLLTGNDVVSAIRSVEWSNNSYYAMYDDTDTTLDSKDYYVVTTEGTTRHVWKCIDNNGNTASTSQPLFSDVSASLDVLYIKSGGDGFQWRYMYSVNQSDYEKYAANTYLPVIENSNATGNAVHGAIDQYTVTNNGNSHNEFANGSLTGATNTTVFTIQTGVSTRPLNSGTNYYNNCSIYFTGGTCNGEIRTISAWDGTSKITVSEALSTTPDTSSTYEITPSVVVRGDGSNASARAIINTSTNTVANVEILNRGSGYTFADVTIVGNNASTTAAARAIIGPFGGHASNPKEELQARYVIMRTEFANNESSQIQTDNDFRTIGILKDPLYANVLVTFDATGPTQNFTLDEKVNFGSTYSGNSTGVVTFANTTVLRLSNASGTFSNSANVTGTSSGATSGVSTIHVNAEDSARSNAHYFQQTHKFGHNFTSGSTFTEDEKVTDSINNANGFVYACNSTITTLTEVKGTFDISNTASVTGATSANVARFNSKISPDLVKGSGTVLMLKNVAAVSRSNTTTETVKLVIKF